MCIHNSSVLEQPSPDSSDGADRGLAPEHFSQAVGGLSLLEILLLICVSRI